MGERVKLTNNHLRKRIQGNLNQTNGLNLLVYRSRGFVFHSLMNHIFTRFHGMLPSTACFFSAYLVQINHCTYVVQADLFRLKLLAFAGLGLNIAAMMHFRLAQIMRLPVPHASTTNAENQPA